MSQSLSGRVALVTGAGTFPGRGMGRSIVQGLAAKGARVLATDKDEATVHETARDCTGQGHDVVAMRADVTRGEDVKAMVAAAVERFGRLDILVNHAGVGSYDDLLETDDAHWHGMLALNLTAAFLASREAVPHMLGNGTGGVILNTISSAGLAGGMAGIAYTTAKHGLVGLTRNVAATYGRKGIRCNGVCPGFVRSPVPGGATAAAGPGQQGDSARLFGQVAQLSPRDGTPKELADVVTFLATDEASFVNGAIIAVDGGLTAI